MRTSMMSRTVEALPEQDPGAVVPFRGMCLVKLSQAQEKTASGIHLLDDYQKRKPVVRGELVSVGEVESEEIRSLAPGTTVTMHGHTKPSYRFAWCGEEYGIFVAEDLVAVEVPA